LKKYPQMSEKGLGLPKYEIKPTKVTTKARLIDRKRLGAAKASWVSWA